jgi:hypothetical protein
VQLVHGNHVTPGHRSAPGARPSSPLAPHRAALPTLRPAQVRAAEVSPRSRRQRNPNAPADSCGCAVRRA